MTEFTGREFIRARRRADDGPEADLAPSLDDVKTDIALAHVPSKVWAVRPELLAALTISVPFASPYVSAGPTDAEPGDGEPAPRHSDGVAVVSLKGVITPGPSLFDMLFETGAGGLEGFMGELREAMDDDEVHAVVLDINSPGGVVDMVPEAAGEMAELRKSHSRKPMVAVANTCAASAAYWLASQASELAVTDSGEVGSIGVYAIHTDLSEAFAKEGIKHTLISAGKYKLEGNPFSPLSDEAVEHEQAAVNDYYEMFVADVARGRRVKKDAVTGGYGEGRTLTASRAVKAGLADRVATLSQVVRELSDKGAKKQKRVPKREENLRLLDALVASR